MHCLHFTDVNVCCYMPVHAIYSVSQKSSPPKTFCDILTCGVPVSLKITVAIAQTYSYVYTNFGSVI